LLIYLYRLCGGQNKWLRTHGAILATYYGFGGVAYDELEGWTLIDTTYFLTVTVTTVGYGDMVPESDTGKIFTVLYALLGIAFVFAALEPLLHALIFLKDIILAPCTPNEITDTDDVELDIDDLRRGGNWTFKYCSALAAPLMVFLAGIFLGITVLQLEMIDGVYWSMVSMTTIGYGDIAGSTVLERVLMCFYLPIAVAALADALAAVGNIGTAKDLVFTDFAKKADQLLLSEAGGTDADPSETLTEAEFLISVLLSKGIVDNLTVSAIQLQFKHLVRHDVWSKVGDEKVLDDRCVFLELKAQGRILASPVLAASPPPKEPLKPEITSDGYTIARVDVTKPDGGFTEWRDKHWIPRVYASTSSAVGRNIRFAPHSSSSKKASVLEKMHAAPVEIHVDMYTKTTKWPNPAQPPSAARGHRATTPLNVAPLLNSAADTQGGYSSLQTPGYMQLKEDTPEYPGVHSGIPTAAEIVRKARLAYRLVKDGKLSFSSACQNPKIANVVLWVIFVAFLFVLSLKIVPDIYEQEFAEGAEK